MSDSLSQYYELYGRMTAKFQSIESNVSDIGKILDDYLDKVKTSDDNDIGFDIDIEIMRDNLMISAMEVNKLSSDLLSLISLINKESDNSERSTD